MATRIPAPRPAMRKVPRQARSRATVEAIVQAGARVLGERGWAGFNTNEVADTAGVSVGSLYQYFPDKEALVEAIRQRHLDDILAALAPPPSSGVAVAQLVDDLVAGLLAAHSLHPQLHHVLLEVAPPHAGARASQAGFNALYLERYRAIVAACPVARSKAERDVVVQVLSAAMEGVIHSAVRNGNQKSAALRRELARMVCAYLAPL